MASSSHGTTPRSTSSATACTTAAGVFEGIRCYETERGPAIFRHAEHLDRLAMSAELYYLPLEHGRDEIREATHELIRRNELRSCYIRPLAFRGYGEMGLYAPSAPVDVMIAVWPWGAYLGEESKRKGIRAKVSSWRRISPAGLIPHAKASGQYLNSILAKTESAKAGYDEAILLDERGQRVRGLGREHVRRPRRQDRDAPATRRRSSTGSRASR